MKDLFHRSRDIEPFDSALFTQAASAADYDYSFQPSYTWVWNVPISEPEICRQLDAMRAAGIRATYIIPEPKEFRPYTMRTDMQPPYLSDEFFRLLRYAAEYALNHGIAVWIYDEGGWPSGSACGQVVKARPELCRKRIAARDVNVGAGEAYHPGSDAISAFDASDGMRCILPGEVFSAPVCLTEYFAEWLPGNNTDPLDSELGKEFVNGTHERYAEFLSDLFPKPERDSDASIKAAPSAVPLNITAMFTDEPGAGTYPWPRGFGETFKARYGYDIAPFIPALLSDASPETVCEEAIQARKDYRQITGELFLRNYFVPIHEWCRANNVLSTGHLDLDHITDGCVKQNYGSVLPLLRELDMPGIDVIWRQIFRPSDSVRDWEIHSTQSEQTADGARLPDCACPEGNGFFPRFASSAAAQTGHKYAMSESFAIYGAGTTGDDMAYALNYQLVRGINIFNFMSASYGKSGALSVVARPGFVSEIPGYDHLCAINDYTARACYIMQTGLPAADTAMYFPAHDIWAGGATRDRAIREFERLGRLLEARHVDFDIIDDEGVRQAKLEGNTLRIGFAEYKHVLIPAQSDVPADVYAAIARLDGNIVPTLECDNASIRIRARKLSGSDMIYMLFNQSGSDVSARISLPEATHYYLLDASNARIEKYSPEGELRFLSGEAKYIMLTSCEIPQAVPAFPKSGRTAFTFSAFSIAKLRETILSANGICARNVDAEYRVCELGSWASYMGADFSGEAVYRAEADIGHTPRAGETYVLDLGKVECSARVSVNGVCVGTVSTQPMRLFIDGAALAAADKAPTGKLVLEIEVANTLANQCVTNDPATLFEKADIGSYTERTIEFEKAAPQGGLYGPVTLTWI